MESSLNMKWRINNHNRWLLVVNITSTAGYNAKITVPMLAILRTFQNTQSFYWEISISVLPSPLQMHFQMNKRRWETERLAGVLVTMAASKWNAKAQETDRESRTQVDVMELPVLLIALLHAQFSSLPSPCISTSSESGRGESTGTAGRPEEVRISKGLILETKGLQEKSIEIQWNFLDIKCMSLAKISVSWLDWEVF